MPPFRIRHFCTDSGTEPVAEFLDQLPELDRAACEEVIEYLESGEIDQRPRHRSYVGDGIWELRVSIRGMQYRVLYATEGDVATLLHAFVKKTPKLPPRQLRLAKQRLKELLSAGG